MRLCGGIFSADNLLDPMGSRVKYDPCVFPEFSKTFLRRKNPCSSHQHRSHHTISHIHYSHPHHLVSLPPPLYSMAAMTTGVPGLEPTRGLWPVSKKPEDKTKDDFVRLVWRELTPDAFKNIGEFQEWFNKTLAPRTIKNLGGAQVAGMLLRVTFPHGGMKHFMRWVVVKFTTTTSPEAAAAAAAEAARVDLVNEEPKKAPSRGLYPVTSKPSEDSETKEVFVPLVWDQITNNGVFSNIAEFKEWYKKIVRKIVSSFGEDPVLGLTAIETTFGGIKHFMTWVMTKFTTTTSPGVAAAAAQRRRERRQLRKQKTTKMKKAQGNKRSTKEIVAMLEYGKTEVVIHSSRFQGALTDEIPYVTQVTQELLEPRHGTTMTIQDLSGFLTTTAFDVLVEQLSGMPFSEKGWRQYLVDRFCSKKMTLSEEIYEGEFQHNLREIKGRYGNWVINNFTRPVGPVAKKSPPESLPESKSLPKSYDPEHQDPVALWAMEEELRKGSAAFEGSAASAVQFVGDTGICKSHKTSQGPALKPGHVVFENCTAEEALLALWKEAGVVGLGWLQQDGSPPTLEECREAATRGGVDYLKGKPMKTSFKDFPVVKSLGYDRDNGPGKMQKVADMLRANGEGKTEGKTESNAPVTLSAAEPVITAEIVEVIPLAEAVAVPVSEEGHAPMAPRAE